MTLASVVEWGDVVQVIWTSLVAGLGVTFAFSLALVGATRAVDLRRDGHTGAASVYARGDGRSGCSPRPPRSSSASWS